MAAEQDHNVGGNKDLDKYNNELEEDLNIPPPNHPRRYQQQQQNLTLQPHCLQLPIGWRGCEA